jgi:flagellar motor component MotA
MDFKNEFIIELMECILSGADELQVKQMLDKETQNLQLQQTSVVYKLCECGGSERVALDCTSKNCRHPKYNKQ